MTSFKPIEQIQLQVNGNDNVANLDGAKQLLLQTTQDCYIDFDQPASKSQSYLLKKSIDPLFIESKGGLIEKIHALGNYYALQFDGVQNYVSIGTLGNLGSNAANGLYVKFSIKTTSTSAGIFGEFNSSSESLYWYFNVKYNETNSNHDLCIIFEGNNNKFFIAGTNNNTTVTFNDGNVHTIDFLVVPSTSTLTLNIDGISQTITVFRNDGGYTYGNFATNMFFGAGNITGSPSSFFACTVDSFKIGTSASNLYASYNFVEGSGTTLSDSSGNGNNGTLVGSPLPLWVNGFDATKNLATIYVSIQR